MRLSLRTLLFAGVIALLAIAAIWGLEPFGVWRFAVFLLAAGLIWEWQHARMRPLAMAIQAAAAPRLGVALPMTVDVAGAGLGRVRHRLQGNAALRAIDREMALTPDAAGALCYTAQARPVRLGATRLPDQWLELEGALGLGYWLRRLPVDTVVKIAPMRLSDRAGTPGGAPMGRRHRARVGQGSELFALRDQRPEDPASRIDWKASVRRGRPVVRETEVEEQLELVLAVDAGAGSGVEEGSLTRFGHAANVASRLAEYAQGQGDRVGLIVFADRVLAQVPVSRGRLQHDRVRAALAAADARDAESNPLAAMLAVRSMVRHRALVVVFSDLDDPDAAGQLVAATRLLRPVHLPLVAAFRDAQSEALRDRPATGWRDPWYTLAVDELDRVAESTRLRLERLGAQVVHARADAMDGALRRRYARLRRDRLV